MTNRTPTGIKTAKGKMIYVGDDVVFDNGMIRFTTRIIQCEGRIGFFPSIKSRFEELHNFVRDISSNPDKMDGAESFEVLSETNTVL